MSDWLESLRDFIGKQRPVETRSKSMNGSTWSAWMPFAESYSIAKNRTKSGANHKRRGGGVKKNQNRGGD